MSTWEKIIDQWVLIVLTELLIIGICILFFPPLKYYWVNHNTLSWIFFVGVDLFFVVTFNWLIWWGIIRA